MKLADKTVTDVLHHLKVLVGCDSQNPPRALTADSEIFNYLRANLPGFNCQIIDAGDGCLCLLAKRGAPELLFNFHIDTVPIAPGWSSDPLTLLIDDEKATGLGACDIKGAAACMLSAVNKTKGDVALLFSSDEEYGSSAAVKTFLQIDHGFKRVIVAEPTEAKAVIAHRGIQSAKVTFKGISGHASEARALTDNAIHRAVRWSGYALDWVKSLNASFENLHGMPFNLGRISGGIKANMIAADCEINLGFRPLPGQDPLAILEQLAQVDAGNNLVHNTRLQIEHLFNGPSLPAVNGSFEQTIQQARNFVAELELPPGEAVNFWTEASLFSAAGLTAVVFGPGSIAQAHTADEWVSINQLQQVEKYYCNLLSKTISFKEHR